MNFYSSILVRDLMVGHTQPQIADPLGLAARARPGALDCAAAAYSLIGSRVWCCCCFLYKTVQAPVLLVFGTDDGFNRCCLCTEPVLAPP